MTAAEAKPPAARYHLWRVVAGLVLVTGITRMFLEKGVAFTITTSRFISCSDFRCRRAALDLSHHHLSALRSDTSAGRGQQLAHINSASCRWSCGVEMTLLLLAPLFATWMAHGDSSGKLETPARCRPINEYFAN